MRCGAGWGCSRSRDQRRIAHTDWVSCAVTQTRLPAAGLERHSDEGDRKKSRHRYRLECSGVKIFESCVDSVEAAIASAAGGAGRIELCARLDVAGLTPDLDLVQRTAAAVTVPVCVMVRPRPGGFVYDAAEIEAMRRSIAAIAAAGAAGIVAGALRRDGTVDADGMRRLIDAARPLPVTFHRAFDATRDLGEALETLTTLGVDRVLTSGGAPTALEGVETIARLVERAGPSLTVIAGGGVRAHNVVEIVQRTRVREVHAWVARSDGEDHDAWTAAVREIVAALGRSA